MSDEVLAGQTALLQERLEKGESTNEILPEAFATIREAASRILGMRPFDVQLLGGVALHYGAIAEMKTGEGKTLVATLPSYLNALTKKGVHVVTVNEYLANHAVETLRPLYEFLGLSVAVVKESADVAARQLAYNADVTYTTNTELGFDYLRDHMANEPARVVSRGLHYAIVDEVDSILIDEARTPLIISDALSEGKELHVQFAALVQKLDLDTHYEIKVKDKKIYPTEAGITKVEELLGVENLYAADNLELVSYLDAHLRAKEIYLKDRDYIVSEDEILLVDEHTGRVMEGRRISHGIHQAIEAKEGVSVQDENQTVASVTLQNYFKLYEKLAGMSGTAAVASAEFDKTYKLEVVVIPPNRPVARVDHPDRIFSTLEEKYENIVQVVKEKHELGQPVLIGTASVQTSEIVAAALKKARIPHRVLNAKEHGAEAKVIALAGHEKAVTVATNMAGRGTDITLGGNPEFLAGEQMARIAHEFDEDPLGYAAEHARVLEALTQRSSEEADRVRELGGLFVLGTERHDSRRIDIQLRGRSGRQGDPGASQFFLSLEDPLLARFPNAFLSLMHASSQGKGGANLASSRVGKIIDNAQSQLEDMHASSRKNMVKYDDVTSTQRRNVYAQRDKVLHGEVEVSVVADLATAIITELFTDTIKAGTTSYTHTELAHLLATEVGLAPEEPTDEQDEKTYSVGEAKTVAIHTLTNRLAGIDAALDENFNSDTKAEVLANTVRTCFLIGIDNRWRRHLAALDALQNGVGLRTYAQKDPVVEFQEEAHVLYVQMLRMVQNDVVRMFLQLRINTGNSAAEALAASEGDDTANVDDNVDTQLAANLEASVEEDSRKTASN